MISTFTIFSDIDIELNQQTDGDIKKYVDHNAIRNSITNILTTSKNSRRMLPEFGSNSNLILFEPMDEYTVKKLGNTIINEIGAWETRIILDNVNIDGDIDNMQYKITITYHIKGIGELGGGGTIKFILKQT